MAYEQENIISKDPFSGKYKMIKMLNFIHWIYPCST